jgi:HK97 family phage major capsid protein
LKKEEGRYSIELRTPGQQTITTTGGGYMIQTDLMPWIEVAQKYYGPMLQACTVFNTQDGRPITWPSLDDTGNTGAAETINADMFDSSTALTFGQISFGAIKYSSEGILVPYELLEDSSFNVAQVVGEALGERLYRKLNTDFTSGDGSGNANGIVYATGGAVIGENAAISAVTRTDIVRLIHSVNNSYRISPKCAFMFNDTTARYLRLLDIGTNDARPVWEVSMRDGQPDKLEGFPFWINNDMDDIGSNKKPIIFGDIGKYVIRQAGPLRVVRLTERYAELDDVGFIVIGRFDGKLLRANTTTYCPVKFLRNLGT